MPENTQTPNKNDIRELQRYLYGISYYNNKIPQIIPDGYYGKETATAVRAFQREYNLPETGTVTPETWDKIVEVYKEYVGTVPVALDVFPSAGYVIQIGENGMIVYVVQAMLYELGLRFDNFPGVKVTGIYDNATANSIRIFQNTSNLTPTGNVNCHTWNHLVATINHIL